MLNRLILGVLVVFAFYSQGQVVNSYAEVTGIAGSVLTLGTVDETGDTFEDDEWVVIMQMQDSVIGPNINNNVNFGDLDGIYNAGVYEIRQVQSHTETAGVPTTLTLYNSPNFTYNFNTNSSVQIISFRQFGSPDYTTTGNMAAKDWDGTTGGVLAIYVPGVLTLSHSLSADESGFQGAGPDAGTADICRPNWYRRTSNDLRADKGNGIHKRTVNNQAAGRAKIANGGGGGSSHNGGGGGGSNYSSGGDGGPGWNNCNPSAGGLGGVSLQPYITADRIFMGGGGGAGEGNNNLATDGGDGGGIILLKADEVTTNACAGVSISANGEFISFAGNDGGGGGGAGGSIILEVNTWNITGGCPLTVESSGGNGGDVNSGGTHGGGGGGGQGVIIYSSAVPSTNVTNTTDSGVGGCDNNQAGCPSQAGSGGGTNGDGILGPQTGPLPIELLDFSGKLINDHVELFWTTKSESNNDYFTIEHSVNGYNWNKIDEVPGAGNSSTTLNYSSTHEDPNLGVNYYRLRQTDFNGTYSFSNIISVKFEEDQTVVYPNPAKDILNIFKPGIDQFEIYIYNSLGQQVFVESDKHNNLAQFDISEVENGIYFAILRKGDHSEHVRFSIEH